ncbi:hypothetical protein [Paraburkholderia terricola]|uniref:hypothetical protein n=1 Tax=Paraburkholderia terricola TaxID=169427 RepID=UPI003ED1544F
MSSTRRRAVWIHLRHSVIGNCHVSAQGVDENYLFRIFKAGNLWCLFDFVQPGLLGALEAFGRERDTEEHHDSLNRRHRAVLLVRRVQNLKIPQALPTLVNPSRCNAGAQYQECAFIRRVDRPPGQALYL